MTIQEQYIARLRELVEAKFGHPITTIEDCDALSEAVGEATNIKLDSRAFVPIFVKTPHPIAPRPVTLSTLARYLGFNSWSEFCSTGSVLPGEDVDKIPVVRRWGVIILTVLALAVVVGAIIFLLAVSGKDASHNEDRIGAVAGSVETRWVARTMEECIALRASRCDSTFVNTLDAFAEEYDEAMQRDIPRDLRAKASEDGVVVEDAVVEAYADSIASRCKSMYEVLYLEK
jgi:hypothetical protein